MEVLVITDEALGRDVRNYVVSFLYGRDIDFIRVNDNIETEGEIIFRFVSIGWVLGKVTETENTYKPDYCLDTTKDRYGYFHSDRIHKLVEPIGCFITFHDLEGFLIRIYDEIK